MLRRRLIFLDKRSKRKIQKNIQKKNLLQNDSSWLITFIFTTLKWFALIFFGLLILLPFFIMISTSLMSNEEVKDVFNVHLVPQNGFHWENFTKAFEEGYWQALLITMIVTSFSIVLRLILTLFMGYAFAYKNWRFKNLVWWFLLALLMIPEMGLMVGQYQMVTNLGLNVGNLIVVSMVLPFVGSIFSGFMFRNAFEAIPNRTKEAALIDGASEMKYFWKVALPMIAPTTWTVIILTTFGSWNSYVWPLLLNNLLPESEKRNVLGTWLYTTGHEYDEQGSSLGVLENVRLAAAILVTLPLIIIYFIFRRRIMNSVSRQGQAIKG